MVLKGKCMIYVARLQKLFNKNWFVILIRKSYNLKFLTLLHLYDFSQNNSILESNIYTSLVDCRIFKYLTFLERSVLLNFFFKLNFINFVKNKNKKTHHFLSRYLTKSDDLNFYSYNWMEKNPPSWEFHRNFLFLSFIILDSL